MFSANQMEPPASRLRVARGTLPKHFNPSQPPSQKRPFSTIMYQQFNHTVDLILPEKFYRSLWDDIVQRITWPQYSKVILPLSALLEGEFFDTYVKSGSAIMLSEGHARVDSLYFLKEGILRLEVSKELYERSGLVGKPIRDIGRKHVKTRYAIEINLRLSSMRHGKKLFEKIVWAFKNVLNKAVMWLFYDQDQNSSTQQRPILRHHPTSLTCEPIVTQIPSTTIPVLRSASTGAPRADFADWATETIEWHGLVTLKSPQTGLYHEIDPYLSRYSVPHNDAATAADIMLVRWSGLITAKWVRQMLVFLCGNGLRHSSELEKWFFVGAYAFQSSTLHGNDGYTILGLSGRPLTEPEQRVKEGDAIEMNEQASVSLRDYVLWEFTNASA